MESDTNAIRCEDCGDPSIRMPERRLNAYEIYCEGCGESLRTIKNLRELLTASAADEPNIHADNDD